MKNSLYKTLAHYLPLAGNLIFHWSSDIPELHATLKGAPFGRTLDFGRRDSRKSSLAGKLSSSSDLCFQNLAATFVNAFVNTGFGQDKLMTVPSEASIGGGSSTSWLFKNKEHGKASAAASLGMIHLWDEDSGLAQLDKYFHSTDSHVTAGALLGVGIVNCNVQNECDPGKVCVQLTPQPVGNILGFSTFGRVCGQRRHFCAIMGLGLAYAVSKDAQVSILLMPLLGDGKSSLDVIAFAAISLDLYGEHNIRRAVPLALGLLCISNPKVNVMDVEKSVRGGC
ncbi:26S proteasome non-ATPase regulatory subunit [Striga asiatica]|uniref:26S proteasome non-ATPase regulatory subunit n=1 Tax=Striga asiatica TaxID=4170 RepID=A0A5A7R2D3_STRAF|nr:26S proteasome non-ATPase regulatory subunit [Striga asiatica]